MNPEIIFYHFENLKHNPQPFGSNWCWAVCLTTISKGLGSNSQIGHNACSLTSYYASNFVTLNEDNTLSHTAVSTENRTLDFSENNCCKNMTNLENNSTCNVGIQDSNLKNVSAILGLTCKDLNISNLTDFEFIKKTLTKNDAPILLKTRNSNGSTHITMISGYGTVGNCRYLAITDPMRLDEEYILFSKIIQSNTIERAWSVMVAGIHDKQLIVNQKIIDNIQAVENILNEANIDSKNHYYFASNAERYKQLLDFSALKQKNEDSIKFELKFPELNSSRACEEYIRDFDIPAFGDIPEVKDSLHKDINAYKHNVLYQTYLKEYATTIEIQRTEKDSIRVKPKTFPVNYPFNKKWMTYNDFITLLNSLPKIQYFSN